jgi:hypothetical protein
MRRIFISYSRKDIAFVRRLAGDLEDAGYEVWWDVSNLRGGDEWVRVIPDAIDTSEYVIVVLSPHAIASEWVRREYTQALHRNKKIIPLMLVNTTMPFSLNTLNYIDFTSEQYTAGYNALLRALIFPEHLPRAPVTGLPHWFGKYRVPVTLSVFVMLAIVLFFALQVPLPFTPLPTALPGTSPTATQLSVPVPGTLVPHGTIIPPTSVLTSTSVPTSTRTPAFQRLTFCVNSRSVNSINVRSGPGIIYPRIGDPLPVGTCLDFRGQNIEGTWLMIAPNQAEPFLRQYEGGWIFRELLGLGAEGPIDLPAITLTPTPTPTTTPTRTATP